MTRALLIARAFRAKVADGSHRARLRVEVGRLRTLLRPLADVSATKRGFALVPRSAVEVAILARPVEEQHAAVLATLRMASHGRARRSRWRLAPASVRYSGRSIRLRQMARCSPSVTDALAAG